MQAGRITISRREVLIGLGLAGAVMGLSTLPYLHALQMANPRDYFAGFIWGVDDGNVYLSWIRQAAEGNWLLGNQYTTAPQDPHFFNVFLLALGSFSALTGLAPIIVFHLARVGGGIFLLYAFFLLIAELTRSRRVRLSAVVIAALSSGLGWITYLQARLSGLPFGTWSGARPMDVAFGWQVQPEAVTFLSLLLNPLFVTAMGLLCLVFRYGLRAAQPESGLRSTVICGVLLLLLGNVHSYDVFVAYSAILVWFVLAAVGGRLSWRAATVRYAVIALLGAAAPLYAYWAARADPAYLAKVGTPTYSAMPWDYALGYGLVLLLAIVGAVWVIRSRRRTDDGVEESSGSALLFPLVWVVLGLGLIYLPVSFQRKLIEGLHLPLCILAAVGLVRMHGWLRGRVSFGLLLVVFVVVTIPSNIVFVADCLDHVAVNNVDMLQVLMPPAYLTEAEKTALTWLAANARDGAVVFSSSLIGNHIPAHTSCRVVAGHWAETLNFSAALRKLGYFYWPGWDVDEREDILRSTGADFVVYGPQEKLVQQGMAASGLFDPDATWDPTIGLPCLKLAFVGGDVRIYLVTK